MFLSMVLPGPSSPGQNMDVCLCPLIDELMQLWSFRALTYDISRKHNFVMRVGFMCISRKHNFVMRVGFMWTINDFPTYGMISG
jgi:hypothetical protein